MKDYIKLFRGFGSRRLVSANQGGASPHILTHLNPLIGSIIHTRPNDSRGRWVDVIILIVQ